MKQTEPVNALERAYELQELIKKERHQLRQHEDEYKLLMTQISTLDVRRVEYYEVIDKVKTRRYIISDLFRAKWPDLFNKLAKITIKDAEAELPPEELKSVCEVRETIKQEIIIYEKTLLQPTGDD
jgi:hypothetical protein